MILNHLKRLVNWVEGEEIYKIIEEVPVMADSTVRPDPSNMWMNRAEHSDKKFRVRFQQWMESENSARTFKQMYGVLAVMLCVIMISVLLATVSFLPKFGNPANPANNEVSKRYIENGLEETGAINIVAGMILDYRAFDTLGESNVLFAAMCAVTILLRTDYKGKKANISEIVIRSRDQGDDVVLKYAAMSMIPFVLVFGIYVVLNGHLSAGGGFSGGAILGAAMILSSNAFGADCIERIFSAKACKSVTFISLMTYACLKSYSFYTGANHIPSGIPLGTPGAIFSSGLILPLNICVGCVVACTMYSFYALFRNGGIQNGS